MGKKIIFAVACWLALIKVEADSSDAPVNSVKLEDSVAEADHPRLYRSVPVGVYASASPYASFSFHVPSFVTSPKVAHVGPIKQESAIVENKQGVLKDSYGNKFIESPQSLPYRAAFPQQYVQLQALPAHFAQPLVAAAPGYEYKKVSPHFYGSPNFKVQTVQAVSPSTSNHYAINQPYEYGPIRTLSPAQQHHSSSNVVKLQRLEIDSNVATKKEKNVAINDNKPLVPLLDLTLLEPLTFENPLVPQVQHFLPRISSVTYQKLPQLNVDGVKSKVKEIMIQKIKSYDNEDVENTPKVTSPLKQQQRSHPDDEHESNEQDPPTDAPNEKFVGYNKETKSEPVHYSYELKSEKEPVSYNYVRTIQEPYREHVRNVNHNTKHDDSQNTKHLVYNFTPEENDDDTNSYRNSQRSEAEDSSEERIESKTPVHLTKQNDRDTYQHGRPEHRAEGPHRPHSKTERIVYRDEEHHRKPDKAAHHNSRQTHSNIETLSVDIPKAHLQPILQEHEENIRVLPKTKKYASIKVDPNQHIQPQDHESREPENNRDDQNRHRVQYQPEQLVEEKGKRIIVTEETPQEDTLSSKELNNEAVKQDGKNEEELENGYNNDAYSFPVYESTSKDTEKEIYNPEPYAPSRYESDFDVEQSPFQRYVAESDEYPKYTRSNYKDARDKTKDKYYLDYAMSKPESMLARFQQKEDYYKTYIHRKPEYLNNEGEADKKTHKQSAKYTAEPSIRTEHHASAQKPKQYFAKYKAAPGSQTYGYDYSKNAPKDNSAYATGPYQRLKLHTQFVEPQFQYGFEPSILPRLLESELSAMASNNSPENKDPLMRKKVYKENWYIKKTSTNGRKASS